MCNVYVLLPLLDFKNLQSLVIPLLTRGSNFSWLSQCIRLYCSVPSLILGPVNMWSACPGIHISHWSGIYRTDKTMLYWLLYKNTYLLMVSICIVIRSISRRLHTQRPSELLIKNVAFPPLSLVLLKFSPLEPLLALEWHPSHHVEFLSLFFLFSFFCFSLSLSFLFFFFVGASLVTLGAGAPKASEDMPPPPIMLFPVFV